MTLYSDKQMNDVLYSVKTKLSPKIDFHDVVIKTKIISTYSFEKKKRYNRYVVQTDGLFGLCL